MSPKWLMQSFPCMSTSTKIRSWTDQYAPSQPTCSTARSHSACGLPHHQLAILTRCSAPSTIPQRPPLQSSPCLSIVSSERHPLTTTAVNHPHRCRKRRRQCSRRRPLPSIILSVVSASVVVSVVASDVDSVVPITVALVQLLTSWPSKTLRKWTYQTRKITQRGVGSPITRPFLMEGAG